MKYLLILATTFSLAIPLAAAPQTPVAVERATTTGRVQLENTGWRTAYLRLEENVTYQLRVTNNTTEPLDKAAVHFQTAKLLERRVNLPLLQPGQSVTISAPVETTLRPDRYEVEVTVQNAARQAVSETLTLPLTIVARPNLQRMPVILRDYGELPQVKEIGFTHLAVSLVDYPPIWEKGADANTASATTTTARQQALDQMLALQLSGIAPLAPGRYASRTYPEWNRVDRAGKQIDNVDALFPRVQQFGNDVGVAVARSFNDSPAWAGSSINSEHRDGTAPSFHIVDKEAYRQATGQEIPSQVITARGVSYQSLPDFPANRVVADNHPILNYYRWYWKNGDGWNLLNSQVNQGMKSGGRPGLFSMYDPAVRAPSLWGSGGDVDYLNQWTYTYPDPLRIALAGDELLAMTAGQPGQKVMNMTQLIWYRSRTTKTPAASQESEWEKALPKAQFISISPDHLSEALWLKLARPVQAIAYHGWGSAGETIGYRHGGYFTTNPETRKRLKSVLKEVVEPLGPTLRQVPDAPTDVAFLESFTSQMLAGRGSYGWSNWSADSYYIACYAGLQPQVIYEETIRQTGLDAYKVLFLTDCDVLTASVVEAIKKFQQRGGLVIGDERLTPAIQPDIHLPSLARGKNNEAKPLLLQKANELRAELDPFYERSVQSSTPDVILRTRRAGNADYIFTVNDNRTFGDYVGQYGLVMEKGLPTQSRLTLNHKEGFVYDMVNRRQVPTQRLKNQLKFDVDLGAGEGNVFMVTPRPVGALRVEANKEVTRGKNLSVVMQLNDDNGQALQAVVPLQVEIRDPQGRLAEQSGYYGALNGRHTIQLTIAPNDAVGTWQVEVIEGLRGQKIVQSFEVR